MGRYKLFIRSTDADPACKRFFGKGKCRLLAAHCLTDHRDLPVIKNVLIIVRHSVIVGTVRKIAQIKNILDMDPVRDSLGDHFLVAVNELDDAAADGTKSENCHLYHNSYLLCI